MFRKGSAIFAACMIGLTGFAHGLEIYPPPPDTPENLGYRMIRVPDMTGDGKDELLSGGYGATISGLPGAGRVHLFNGVTGALMRTFQSPQPGDGGQFGSSLAVVPDVSGDGLPDFAIGAWREAVGGVSNAGRVHLFDAWSGAFLRTLVSPAPNDAFFGNFGCSIAGMPDYDNNGFGEVAVGARFDRVNTSNTGKVYVFDGGTGALLGQVSLSLNMAAKFGESVCWIPNALEAPLIAIGASEQN